MSKIETLPRSVSQTEQYEKCGHQFCLQRVERVPQRPAAWSMQGTAFHGAAEVFEKRDRIDTADDMVDLYSDWYSMLVNKELDKEPDLNNWMTAGGKPAGQDIEDRYSLGQDQVRQYVKWSQENGPDFWVDDMGWDGHDISEAPNCDPTVGLELYFNVELGGVKVRGYIDQLVTEDDHSAVRVRDLKTGSTKSKFQLETYAVAVRKQFGLQVNKGDWYFGKDGRLSRPVDLSKVTEEEVGARYAEMDQGVKAGRFEPKPGYHCRFCPVAYACQYRR